MLFKFSMASVASVSLAVDAAPRTGVIRSRAFAASSSRVIGLAFVPFLKLFVEFQKAQRQADEVKKNAIEGANKAKEAAERLKRKQQGQ